jgi:hypothetical protein
VVILRNHRRIFVMAGPFGVTFWRQGALSLQWRGHFLQILIGDWWMPRDDPQAAKPKH